MSENEQTHSETTQVEQQQAPDVVAVLQIMHHTMQEQVYLLSEVNKHLQWQRQFQHKPMMAPGLMPQQPMFTHQPLGTRGDFGSQMALHPINRALSLMDSRTSECDLILDAFIEMLQHARLLSLNATVLNPLDRTRAVLQRRLSELTLGGMSQYNSSGSERLAPGSFGID